LFFFLTTGRASLLVLLLGCAAVYGSLLSSSPVFPLPVSFLLLLLLLLLLLCLF